MLKNGVENMRQILLNIYFHSLSECEIIGFTIMPIIRCFWYQRISRCILLQAFLFFDGFDVYLW